MSALPVHFAWRLLERQPKGRTEGPYPIILVGWLLVPPAFSTRPFFRSQKQGFKASTLKPCRCTRVLSYLSDQAEYPDIEISITTWLVEPLSVGGDDQVFCTPLSSVGAFSGHLCVLAPPVNRRAGCVFRQQHFLSL
jgi:hypothetical protein